MSEFNGEREPNQEPTEDLVIKNRKDYLKETGLTEDDVMKLDLPGVDLNQQEDPKPESLLDTQKAESLEVDFEPLNIPGVELDSQTPPGSPDSLDSNQINLEQEKQLSADLTSYVETQKQGGEWQADYDFAKKLAQEGKFEEALKLAILAREAQIKEGSQQETPAERQSQ